MASLIRLIDNLGAMAASPVGSVGDPDGTRTMTSIIALLVALGLGLVLLAIWMWRSTRPDPELLAPLEAMDDRRWRRGDPVWQRRRLDELRPEGAEPLVTTTAPPEVDASFDDGPSVSGFDDLGPERVEPAPGVVVHRPPAPEGDPAMSPASVKPSGTWTPPHLKRLVHDGFDPTRSRGDIDPDTMAAAMAEIDAELARDEPPSPQD